ncbi:MAG TPA: CRTAC1 family protein [Verrucomicrobiota bacterium]|nr:CRTAC1 family protein [Verrucomicrobiota bacterium]
MAKRLDEMIRRVDPSKLGFLSRERVALIQQHLPSVKSKQDSINLRMQLGQDLINAGESERGAELIGQVEREIAAEFPAYHAQVQSQLLLLQAIGYLRLGEQENCLAHHTSESCLMPLRDAGIHQLPRGSRQAIEILNRLLAADPVHLGARWLLNVAYMTLGEYPAKVPSAQLIPPEQFKSDYDLGRFREVAHQVGLDNLNLAGGSVVEDFDSDGDLDLMISSMGLRDPLRYFRNNGDGTFTDRSEAAGLTGEVGGLNVIHADYDNDGHADVLVLRGGWMGDEGAFPNSLLRGRGDGTFVDVTEEAGLLSFHPTQTAVWFDYDGDGWLDLFIGNETQETGKQHPCELFRNNRNGTFTECARALGVAAVGMVKGVTAGDYNNDGRPDLYLSLRGAPNILFRNHGPADDSATNAPGWKFTNVTAEAGVAEPNQSFTTWFFDYDNDGWLDLFVAGYRISGVGDVAADYLGQPTSAERVRLFRNLGTGKFEDVTQKLGLSRVLYTMGANFGDLDNDGWLDFYLGTGDPSLAVLIPNRMFRNDGGRKFQDVTTSGGFGHLQKGHGVSFADFDQDGDQDIFEEIGGAFSGDVYRNVLFENPGHGNHWIKLRLIGQKANRAAIGARLRLVVRGPEGRREIHRVVGTGGSFGGNPLLQEIGLGPAAVVEELTVEWPGSRGRDTFKSIAADQSYRLTEGSPTLARVELRPFRFGADVSVAPALAK